MMFYDDFPQIIPYFFSKSSPYMENVSKRRVSVTWINQGSLNPPKSSRKHNSSRSINSSLGSDPWKQNCSVLVFVEKILKRIKVN